MAQKIDPESPLFRACRLAVDELIEMHGGQSGAARETGIKQQSFSGMVQHGKLGLAFAHALARAYDTTLDGLIRRFVGESGEQVRVGDLPGWARAVAEAKEQFGDTGYSYELAAEVVLPIAPNRATAIFARDLARFLYDYTRQSEFRMRAVVGE